MSEWEGICTNPCVQERMVTCFCMHEFAYTSVLLCVTERPPATPKSVRHMLPALPQNLKTVCVIDRDREGEERGEERTGRGQFVSGVDSKQDVLLRFKQVKHFVLLLQCKLNGEKDMHTVHCSLMFV